MRTYWTNSPFRAAWPIALAFLSCVSIAIWQSNKGLGLTDDSFFLNWTISSQHYKYSVSEFGYVFHPLYRLVSGDLAFYRLLVLAIQAFAGLTLAWGILGFFGGASKATRTAISLSLATATFWICLYGHITPTYNTLNLIGVLLALSGLLYATSEYPAPARTKWEMLVPALILAAGLCLTALAKPTTAIATFALAIAWVALLRPPAWATLVLATGEFGILLFGTAVYLIDGSIVVFLQRKLDALAVLTNFATGHDAGGLVHSVIGTFIQDNTGKEWKFFQFGLAVLFLLLLAYWWSVQLVKKAPHPVWTPLVAFGIPMLMAAVTGWLHAIAGPATGLGWPAWAFRALQATHFVLPITIAGFCLGAWREIRASDPALRRRVIVVAALLSAAPFAYAFGTNSVVIITASLAGVFWAASLLLLTRLAPAPRQPALTISASFLCAAVTVGTMAGGSAQPFQLYTPFWQQTEAVRLSESGATVLVDGEAANYIRTFQTAATAHGFKPGMPIIDASGNAPGAILAIGGVQLGTPILVVVKAEKSAFHMNARQHDVDQANAAFIHEVLRRVDAADRNRAWILSRSPDENVPMQHALRDLGLDFPSKYVLVAEASFHPDIPLGVRHFLWKPR